jgi:hypothetical protein
VVTKRNQCVEEDVARLNKEREKRKAEGAGIRGVRERWKETSTRMHDVISQEAVNCREREAERK